METLEQPTPFIRNPYLDGCEYMIRFGSRYPFPCFVLVEENPGGYNRKFEDLRLYPLTDKGREAADADLRAIEASKRKLAREMRLAEMREDIAKRHCFYCKHYPKSETVDKHTGSKFMICDNRKDASWSFDRIVRPNDTCKNFELADEYKNI